MCADEFSTEQDNFHQLHDGNSTPPVTGDALAKRLFVLLQRTIVNYSVCMSFLCTELVGSHRAASLDSIPTEFDIRDPRELLRGVHQTHDTIKEIFDNIKDDTNHKRVIEEHKTAQNLFTPVSEHIVQTFSRFESLAVVEETHRIEDNHVLAGDRNFFAVVGCALLRPLARACSILGDFSDISDYGWILLGRYARLMDAINMACRNHLDIFCRHFRCQVTNLQAQDGNLTPFTIEQIRLTLLAQVVRGFDPDEDPGVLKNYEAFIPIQVSPPSDSSMSASLTNSWMRINGSLGASVPYASDEPESDDEYENSILREIQTAEEGISIPLMSTYDGYVLDILQSLVFFVDMMPLIVRQVRQLYHFRGVSVLPEKWATLAESHLSIRLTIVDGGTNILAMKTTVQSIIELLTQLVDCLNLAFTDNKWPPHVLPAYLLDIIQDLGLSLAEYIQYILSILEKKDYFEFSNNLDSRAHAALLDLFDTRYQILYDLVSAQI